MLILRVVGHASGSLLPFTTVALVILIICGVTYLLAQRGQTTAAGHVYSYGMVLIFTLSLYLFGGSDGNSGPGVIGYFVPIAAAGLLGRSKDVLYVSIFAAVCYTLSVITQDVLDLTPVSDLGVSGPYVFLAFFFASGGILAYLSWVTSRDLTRALVNYDRQAEELLDRTTQLEDKSNQQIELGSELSAAASQLQITSQQQASGATQQASAVSEVSTTVEELGATARQIAQSAEHVAQAAQQTLEHLSNGQGAVDESVQAMERIRVRMQDISTRVLSLGERSQQIGEIIDLIDDISDSTHLLALNAAIEAAGAGEHGRRFAVVAAEVKSLANRTLAAAKEVQGMIAEIRQATNAAVLAAEEGGKEVERGAELSYRAGQVMDTILMVAERTAQSAAEIGMATAQQQSASEQVVEAMREIAEVARQSAAGSRQMAESASMLTAIADRLHGITHQ
ncbi:MAG: methyl-accepting chemotaxis protein [Chloroflexaceae bacterium]|nr:methyl-accepting chemotaxis protein [Chloroflexaceae bacterium]